LLYLIEETLDQVACAIEMGLKQIGSLRFRVLAELGHSPFQNRPLGERFILLGFGIGKTSQPGALVRRSQIGLSSPMLGPFLFAQVTNRRIGSKKFTLNYELSVKKS
jgi:hypothetical protein